MKHQDSSRTLRPTTGKVREAFFNILRNKVKNARFLDLYAGSGMIGIEALQRGASETVFVEMSRSAIERIRNQIKKYHVETRSRIVRRKALSYVEWADAHDETFDIIFLDPPYHTDVIEEVLSAIGKTGLVNKDGIVVAEHYSKRYLPETFDNLHKKKDYRYGDSVLTFYVTG